MNPTRFFIGVLGAILSMQCVLGSTPPVHPPERINCLQAFRQCDFKFLGFPGIPTFNIGGIENRPFTTRVVSKTPGEILGVLNSNSIVPEFIIDHQALKITLFGTQKFTPTAFKPFSIPRTSGSGVGRETFHGDQLSIADGMCVRLFFSEYQTLLPNGNVKANFNNVPKTLNKCVVFRTIVRTPPPPRPAPPPPMPPAPVHPPVRINCLQAFRQCDFKFFGFASVPTFNIRGIVNRPFTTRVVSKTPGEILGVLNSNSIVPEFIIDHQALKITLFGTQKFTPTAFKPFSIPRTSGSGVGRETFHGDQLSIANGMCVRLFFSEYQTLLPNGNVKANFNNVPKRLNKCVVFRVVSV